MTVRDESPLEAATDTPVAAGTDTLRPWLSSFGNLAAGEFVASLLRFVGLLVAARHLGPAAFGTMTAGYAVGLYVTLFAHSGLETIGTRSVARAPGDANRALGEVVGLRLLLAATFYGLLLVGCLAAPLDGDMRLVVILFGCSVFTFAADVRWSFIGIQRTRPVAFAAVLSALAYTVAVVLLVRDPSHLVRVPLVHVGAEVVLATVLVLASRRRFGAWRPRLPRARLRPLLAVSLPVTVMLGMRALTISVDVVLAKLLVRGTEAGHYAAASRINTVGISYIGLYYISWLPSVVQAYDAGSDALRRLVRLALLRAASVGPGVVLVATLATPALIRVVLGSRYTPTASLLQVLLWGLLLLAFTGIYSSVLLAVDAQRILAGVTLVALAVNVVANLLLLPMVGAVGASIATLLTEGTMLVLTYLAARPYLKRTS